MSWFQSFITEEIQKRHDKNGRNGESILAREVGVDRTTIARWATGMEPRLKHVEIVVKHFDIDLRQRAPGYVNNGDREEIIRKQNERIRHLQAAIDDARTALDRANHTVSLIASEDPPQYSGGSTIPDVQL